MVRAEFHFLRDFILSPLPVITERSFFPPHPRYRSPKAGSRAFNGPWEHVSVKLPHCGEQTRETHHIQHNTGQLISSGISVSKRNVIVGITIYQRSLKMNRVRIHSQKTKSQTSSFSPNPKPFEISACAVREEVPRSAPNAADWCAENARRTCILPRWEGGSAGALSSSWDLCVFIFATSLLWNHIKITL